MEAPGANERWEAKRNTAMGRSDEGVRETTRIGRGSYEYKKRPQRNNLAFVVNIFERPHIQYYTYIVLFTCLLVINHSPAYSVFIESYRPLEPVSRITLGFISNLKVSLYGELD